MREGAVEADDYIYTKEENTFDWIKRIEWNKWFTLVQIMDINLTDDN